MPRGLARGRGLVESEKPVRFDQFGIAAMKVGRM
jgi:hypothetical protein